MCHSWDLGVSVLRILRLKTHGCSTNVSSSYLIESRYGKNYFPTNTSSLKLSLDKHADSPFWKGLIRVKEDLFVSRGSFVVGIGQSTRFWKDIWLGNTPLSQVLWDDEFRRALTRDKWTSWLHWVSTLMGSTYRTTHMSFVGN